MNEKASEDTEYDWVGFICPNCHDSVWVDGAKPIPKFCSACNEGWIAFLVRKCDFIGTRIEPPPVPSFLKGLFWIHSANIRICPAKKFFNAVGVLSGIYIGIISAYYIIHHSNLSNIVVGSIAIAITFISSFLLYLLTSTLLGLTVWIIAVASYLAIAFIGYKIIVYIIEVMRH